MSTTVIFFIVFERGIPVLKNIDKTYLEIWTD